MKKYILISGIATIILLGASCAKTIPTNNDLNTNINNNVGTIEQNKDIAKCENIKSPTPRSECYKEIKTISSSECSAQSGEIINTLTEDPVAKGKVIGTVADVRCPCVCVISASSQTPESSNKNSLDLSNKSLTAVPVYVFDLTGLKELNISKNRIGGAIQAEIRKLEKLEVLNASNNVMTGVPAEIGQLKNLRILNLSNNKLTGLPNELGNLNNLQVLDLSGNDYSKQDLDIIKQKLPNVDFRL